MKNRARSRLVLAAASLAMTLGAHATSRTWDASSGTDWNTTNTSWSGTIWNNATSDQAIFGATGAGSINLTTAITANRLTFNTGGYTISGNTLTLSGTSPAIINTAGANAVNSNITFGAATTITNSDAANGLSLGGNFTGATTALTFTGAGTTTLSGTNTGLGDIRIASSTPSVGNLAISGGSTTFKNFNIGYSNGTAAGNSYAGVYTQSGGTVTCNGTANLILGDGNTTNQTLTASFIQTGGTFNDNSQGIYMGNWSAVLMDISGTSTFTALNRINIGLRGNSTLNISGNAVVTMPHVAFGGWGGWAVGTGVLNLDGGVLALAGGVGRNGTTGQTTTFNFNGGILRATSSTPGGGQSGAYTDFMGGGSYGALTNAYVKEGGAIIDTQANTITISQALKHGGAAPTDGGLTKQGTGTLTLAGANTYTGATTVTAGTLAISSAGTAALSDITVKNTGTLRVDATGKTLKSLTMENGGILALAASTSATTTVTNALSFTSTPAFTVKPIFAATPVTGLYTLLTPGSISGTAGAITTDLGIYGGTRVYTGTTSVTGGNLVLDMNAAGVAANITWNNGGGTGKWSLISASDNNFDNAGSNDMFYNQDTVTFDGTAPGTVTLVGSLSPAAVQVTSSAGNDYTFAGSGGIGGTTALNKSGGSTLTVNTANTYSGGTNLTGGTLALGHSGALGTTGAISFGGGTLQYDAANTTDYSSRFSTAAGQAYSIDTNGQSVTLGTALSSSGGTLTKSGTGTLKLNATPTYGGTTLINGGTLELYGNTVTYGGGDIQINNGATLKFTGSRYDVNGKTITFGNTGGGTVDATTDAFGGVVQLTAGNTFVTTGGAQNQFIGAGYNLNNNNATFDVAPGTDAVSDLKVTGRLYNSGGIAKTGDGVLELTSNSNGYGGTTAVNRGTLLMNGTNSGAGAVNVSADGTLGGTGSFVGAVNVAGVLSPGASIESLGTGTVSFAAGSTFAYELNSAVLNGDLVDSTGTLDIAAGSILTLNDLAAGTLANDSKLTLISYFGGWTSGELFTYLGNTLADDSAFILGTNEWLINYNDTTGGSNFAGDQTGATGFVTMTVVPEPSAALLGALGLLALLRRRRN